MRMIFATIVATLIAATPTMAQTELTRPKGDWSPPGHDLAFPESFGELKRGRLLEYGNQDWSATYNLQKDGHFHILTIYFYRVLHNTCEGERYDSMASLLERQRNVATKSEKPVAAPRGAEKRAWLMRYTLDWPQGEGHTPATSDLYFYCNPSNDWAVKYRSTGNIADVADQADAIMRSLNWPAKLIE